MGPPREQNIPPCCCPASRAQPQSSTHQHPPVHSGLGLLAPHPSCLLTSWMSSRLNSFSSCPKLNSSGGQEAQRAVSRRWGSPGGAPERGSQPQASPAAQTSSEYCIFLPSSCPPQPSHHAAFLHPGKVLPDPKLSGDHRTRGFLTTVAIRDTALGLPSCRPALCRCPRALPAWNEYWGKGQVPCCFFHPQGSPCLCPMPSSQAMEAHGTIDCTLVST